uniref:RNA-binding protein 33 n=1 Tax=Sphenodon punctatus TaxID=8508 RepID=A0A8D0G664_SPHPU
GKKNHSDLSDEELNDDLLQSDNEEEQNFRYNANDQSVEHDSEYERGEDEITYDKSEEPEEYAEEYVEEGQYEGHDAELTEDQIEYGEEQGEEEIYNDEVLDLEINEPLDEFPAAIENLEIQEETKEESDEEEDDDEESGRLRFKTERKEGTIIRLSDVTRERRNIPETLGKIQWECKVALMPHLCAVL